MHQYYLTIDGLYINAYTLTAGKRELIATAHSNAKWTMIDKDGANLERAMLCSAFPMALVELWDQGPDGNSVKV